MKIGANQIRPGTVIEHEGRQFGVLKSQLITPGKGGAFIQVDMRDITSGVKTNPRWRTAETVEKLATESQELGQALYAAAAAENPGAAEGGAQAPSATATPAPRPANRPHGWAAWPPARPAAARTCRCAPEP